MVLNWGVVSSGKISNDFVCAVQTLQSKDHCIFAVGARTLASAKEFAGIHGIPKYFEGYEAIAKHPDVDIVYVGAINTAHLEVSKLMLSHNKHVLCEKPLTINSKQTSELLQYAKAKKLFFMEAIWSRCFPIYKELRQQLDTSVVGTVLYVYVSFGFDLKYVDRINLKELGGGGILDIGIYALQFCQFVYKGLKPTKFVASGFLNDNGVDMIASAIINYPEMKSATISISCCAEYPNEAVIVGTKGTIKVPNFWCPATIIHSGEEKCIPLPQSDKRFNFHNSVGLCYEAEECLRCIKNGLLESPCLTHEETMELSELMDTWRKQIGVCIDESEK